MIGKTKVAAQNTAEDVPLAWQNAFISLHNGLVGAVKSTNKYNIEIEPMKTVKFSGLVRKSKCVDSAIAENTKAASSRSGVCPREVTSDKVGSYQRVHVRFFIISAKTIKILSQTI